MVVPLRQLPLDSSLQGIVNWDIWGPGRATDASPKVAVLPNPLCLADPPRGAIGEEAKLRLRSARRQPACGEMASDPFAKSNNFGFVPGVPGTRQG